ncbi:sensor histidine kinase [Desulfolutivibrio sulfoxidireducens]|uniref:sensor histidine kinase n=1 Tax=Desulfolutivibrio sulfoxidireducens TaxID=2773299 RepID=UPI00159D7DCB|nr:HAMP domain-containing sensor histidine kinase [Desulfolutivibrio sulfoxidireducens]QLA19250.1 sensor histidine kinase [Desulfolutivibrio sulfoxidireducens]
MPKPEDATRPLSAPETLSGLPSDAFIIERARLDAVARRIHRKMDDYGAYGFTSHQSISLNVFFDLAQEFPDLEDLYAICLLIPRMFFEVDCDLFILDSKDGVLKRCAYRCLTLPLTEAPEVIFSEKPLIRDNYFFLPIKGNHDLISQLPFTPRGDIIGVLCIHPANKLDEHDRLFFERYANRFGYQLHNRIINNKNKEHIQFIRSLVKDIGHNVIVPNIYFKLYYKRLHSKIDLLNILERKLERFLRKTKDVLGPLYGDGEVLLRDIEYIRDGMDDQYKQIYNHYMHTSLFLETLLRRSHFEEGRYVLEKRVCNFKTQVIDPQLERYRPRLIERGVEIDTSLGGVPDAEIEAVADVGLMSQVYANLFSNVVKYAREVADPGKGRTRKFMSYGWEVMPDFFGPDRDGIKLNVFSSGPPMEMETARRLFEEGFRADNAKSEYGTGHGLYFIREVVRLHGGLEGYEPTPLGNNFYFILPKEPEPSRAMSCVLPEHPGPRVPAADDGIEGSLHTPTP